MRRYNIGYTNGVFDLFHVGHLSFLKEAKKYCDYLIVAVCEDELVFKHKSKYPIFSASERMELLSGLKYVDQVVLQTTTNRIFEWDKYHFDVIFHGIDGKEWDMRHGYYDALKERGVESIYFERKINISTTEIIKKVLSGYTK